MPGSAATPARRPLEGITVVALEQAVAAPLCTARLADAGARVIKIERPGGDFARGYDDAVHGDSSYFAWANHGKESVVLDLTNADDLSLLERIIAASDVFVQNLAPGATDRLGIGSEELRARYERLVTCDISGYGHRPDLAAKKAYDLLIQAESGMIGVSGGPNELGRIGVSICDIGAGMTAHAAILEALIERSVRGCGAGLHVSLFDVAAEWMSVPYAQHVLAGAGPLRVGLRHPTIAPYGAYRTSDGELTLVAVQNEREWHRLCTDVLDLSHVARDPRFASNPLRVENREPLEAELEAAVGTLDAATFRTRLTAASVAFGGVSSLDDLAAHPALRLRPVRTSTGAVVSLPAHPVRRAGMAPSPTPTVPGIGHHTDDIRNEFRAR